MFTRWIKYLFCVMLMLHRYKHDEIIYANRNLDKNKSQTLFKNGTKCRSSKLLPAASKPVRHPRQLHVCVHNTARSFGNRFPSRYIPACSTNSFNSWFITYKRVSGTLDADIWARLRLFTDDLTLTGLRDKHDISRCSHHNTHVMPTPLHLSVRRGTNVCFIYIPCKFLHGFLLSGYYMLPV